MATRKPIVIVDGMLRQMAAGDILDAQLNEVDFVTASNDEVGAIVIGTPTYVNGDDTVKKALADAIGTSDVLGLVVDITVAASDPARILTDGRLAATTTQWDAVSDETGGLVAGSVYYLDPSTAGKITSTAPTTDTEVVARVGKALSTTILEVSINQPILL
jgi:hypothetical protein